MKSARDLMDGGSVNGESIKNEEILVDKIPIVKIEDDDKSDSTVLYKESQCDNTIDFTADITLDQLNRESVMDNPTEMENVEFDSEEMNIDRSSLIKLTQESDKKNLKCTDKLQDVVVIDEPKDQWYDEQIDTKVKTVVERLSKLARELKNSYPCYRNCLNRIEEKIGTPVCKLDPPRRYPLDQIRINRWKFVCTHKPVKESADSMMTDAGDNNVKTVWKMHPCDRSNTIANNSLQIPTFVMRAVEMFENFTNSVDEIKLNVKVKQETKDDDIVVLEGDDKLCEGIKTSDNDTHVDIKPHWLWLLVRSNSKDELMMFITGKCITHSTMNSLKKLFESELGKKCNVKSLYCKSVTRSNNVQTSNTTFLVGAEALDETVGGLKIQLAPKTNFWLSTAGAEELAKTVESFIDIHELETIIDIGCGLGLIGLSVAKKCYQVIGIDSPSEIEEAEMTCELNKIKNAYFLMGEPMEMMEKIEKSVDWRRICAIINANTNIGRTTEIIVGLRKIKNLRRIIMVTTLTKQSVRPILELARPADNIIGDPFVATRAAVVDTLPTGSQFEVVILMERRPLPQVMNAVLVKASPDLVVPNASTKSVKNSSKNNNAQKSIGKKSNLVKNTISLTNKKGGLSNNKFSPSGIKSGVGNNKHKLKDSPTKKFVKNPFYDKPLSSKNNKKNLNQKKSAIGSRPYTNSNQHKTAVASRSQINSNQYKPPGGLRPQIKSKSPRKNTSDSSYNMNNAANNVALRLSDDSQKRKYEWDIKSRSEHDAHVPVKRPCENNGNLQSRMLGNHRTEVDLLQKVREQQRLLEVAKQKLTGSSQLIDNFTAKEVHDVLNLAIERTNQIQSQLPRPAWDKVVQPGHLSPDVLIQDEIIFKERHIQEINQEDIVIASSNHAIRQTFDASWTYNRRSNVPPLEPNLLIPRDVYTVLNSDIRDNKSQNQNEIEKRSLSRWIPPSCTRRSLTPSKNQLISPSKRMMSPSICNFQPHNQQISIQSHDIVTRHQIPSTSRQFPPIQRSLSSPRQPITTPIPELMPRRVSPSLRQVQMSTGFADDWDIPSRGASEQQTNWQRTIDNRSGNNTNNRWDFNAQQDKVRQGNNSNLNWDGKNSGINNWTNSGGGGNSGGNGGSNVWNYKQTLAKSSGKDQRQQQQPQQQQQQPILPDNRFVGPSSSGWNVRGKETVNTVNIASNEPWKNVTKQTWNEPQQYKNSWNKNNNKDDWNDLPEDARDPWGDDRNSCGSHQGNRNRNQGSNEWSMAAGNWQNSAPPLMSTNTQWQKGVSNFKQNMDIPWNGRGGANDNMKQSQQNAIWQQENNKRNNSSNNNNNNNNNAWRQHNLSGGFQQQRHYN